MIPLDELALAEFVAAASAAIGLVIPSDERADVVSAARGFALQAAIVMAFPLDQDAEPGKGAA